VARHVEVRFRDGEVMVGAVDGPATEEPGFFLVPADPGSNNLRVYVVVAATRAVYALPAMARAAAGSRASGDNRARRVAPGAPLLPSRLLTWLTR
jgi:hypothetical protein